MRHKKYVVGKYMDMFLLIPWDAIRFTKKSVHTLANPNKRTQRHDFVSSTAILSQGKSPTPPIYFLVGNDNPQLIATTVWFYVMDDDSMINSLVYLQMTHHPLCLPSLI
jgi:hypothetical protein